MKQMNTKFIDKQKLNETSRHHSQKRIQDLKEGYSRVKWLTERRVDLFLTCNHLSNALLSLHSRSQWCGILNQVKKCKCRLPILAPPFVVMVK